MLKLTVSRICLNIKYISFYLLNLYLFLTNKMKYLN